LELAEDLERWLRGEAIQARAASALEKVGKWTRRHPVPSVLAVLLLLTAAFGLTGIIWQWQRANREAPKHDRTLKPHSNRQRKLVQTRPSHGE